MCTKQLLDSAKKKMHLLRPVISKPSLLFSRTKHFSSVANTTYTHHCSLVRSFTTTKTKPRSFTFGGIKFSHTVSSAIRSMSSSLSQTPAAAENTFEQVELLRGINDDHGGIIVELHEPMDSKAFVSMLKASISYWREEGKRGVWIKLPIQLVNLVEAAVKEGFWYHHAEPSYLMLVYWIPKSISTLPVNATHRVGVGAFVLNEKREILVVQEKSGKFRGSGVWKVPTGVVDQGEDISAAAEREVKEETGINAKFMEVLAFRQSHKSFFEKSDLFFICVLQPLSFDIQKQESEIEAAQWMPFEEYANQPFAQKHELMKYMIEMCSARLYGQYSGFSPVLTASSFSNKKDYLYLDAKGLNRS